MTPIHIELFGKLRLTCEQRMIASVTKNRLRSLLAYLVLHSGVTQSREHLAFLLWPDSGDAQARPNLRQSLFHLRRALPVDCPLLVTDNHSVCWQLHPSCRVDVFEFEASLRAAESLISSPASTRAALETAIGLYQDDLLSDLYETWLEPRRQELRQELAEALTRLSSLLEEAGEFPSSIRYATRLLTIDPLREAYYQLLMRLHIENHDRSSALRVYHQCMRNLQRELGVSPSKDTQEIFMQALKSEIPVTASADLYPPHVPTGLQPIIGRKAEWESLVACWQRVSRGGFHVMLLLGEAGIGKTRLAEAFFEHCARDTGVTAIRCRCYLAQGQLAYGAVAELLRVEPFRGVRAQLPKSQLAELARLLPELLVEHPDMPPLQPLTESWQRLHLSEALNSAFRAVPKPLLLFIDDLQWCDRDSFAWLQSLFVSGTADRMLMLGTVRPEDTERGHPLYSFVHQLRQSGQLSELELARLNAEETLELATQLTGRNPAGNQLSRLHEATNGNPLFVVESVRASLEGRETGTVPPGIQSVITARLAQLSQSAYEVAGLAAVIGRPFSFDLVAKALDWDEGSLSGALEELWQRRFIEGQGAAAYDYTHGLLREVAYAGLSPIRRRWLHRRVARALEEMYAPDLEGISGHLAAHYDAAGMAQEAIRFYRTAASIARGRFADAEAAALLRRALELCRDLPETAQRDRMELELLLMLGPALVTTQGYSMPEVGETYQRGLLISDRIGGRDIFSVRSGAWLFRLVRGDVEESRRIAQDCVDNALPECATAQEMAGRFILGTSLFHLGRLAESRQQIEQASLYSDGPPHPALAMFAGPDIGVFSRAYVSHLRCLSGDAEQGVAKSEEAILRARDMSQPFALAIALVYAAMLNVYRRNSKCALSYAEEASAVCRKYGFSYYLAIAEILAGWAVAVEGNPSAGAAQLRLGLDSLKLTGAELRLPFYYGLMSEACALEGSPGEAMADIASGFAFLNKNGEAWAAAELHRIHADLLLQGGDVVHAQASYRRAVEAARQTAYAQGGSAVLSGTLTDVTGAAVPGGTVTLVNTETNLTLTTRSNDSGLYSFPTVPTGNYTMTVEHDGFQKFQQKGIVLTVSQQATLPVSLAVGSTDQVIDVTANAPLLNATNAEVSNTVGEQAVRELPLNGRDPSSLVLLSPGIVNILSTSAGTQQNQTTFPNETGASAGGGRQGSTLYLLDGVPNMDTYMLLAAPSPNSDATGQFRVISNNFDAHYGFSPGAVVSIETKSGTNSFHGGVFEFLRNSALNSSNYFSHAVDPLKRNQFGGFLGGPVIKDRLFFFTNYQQTRQSSSSTGNSVNLPTAAMLSGDFSGYNGTLRGPFATVGGRSNQINPALFDPAALTIARTVFPLSTNASGLYYYTTPKTVEIFHEATGRLDYTVNQNQRLALRSFIQYYNRPQAVTPGNALSAVTAKSGKLFNEVLNHTWTITPTTVNELSLFWNQMNVSTGAPTLTSSGSQFCLSQVAAINDPAGFCYLGTLTVTGGFSASNSGFTGERRNSFGFNEGITKTLGNHTIAAGADLWHQWARENTSYPSNPLTTFSGYYTGLGLADYLLGKVGTYLQGAGELAEVKGNLFGAFAQDQYRMTPNLTITAGLRWDPNLMPDAKDGRGAVYSPGQQSTKYPGAPRGLVFPGDSGVPNSLVKATYGYFEPRLAIAYQWTPKTAIRAGFGMFSAPLPYSLYNHTVDVSPFSPTYTLNATLNTADIQLSNPWANYTATGRTSPFPPFVYGGTAPAQNFNFGSQTSVSAAFSPGFKLGMTQSWNFSVEQQFGRDFAMHLAYVGSQSYHQTTGIDRNPGQIATAAVRGIRPNAAFTQLLDIESFGTASYHSLQAQFEKRMSHGLQFQESFTWSKNIDIISSGNVTFSRAYLPNPYDIRYNRGISSLNIPLNSVTNVVYVTPSLSGRNSFLRAAFGEWEGSIIYTMRSGLPFGINGGNGNNNSGSLQNQDRADRNPTVLLQTHQGSKQQWLQQYFTTASFGQNAPGTFGNSGRNLLQGPGLNYGDLALMKNWTARDRYRLQFRWEMFNAFNHTSFATPDNTVGSSTFGRITAIGPVAPRIQQAGLKLTF